MAASQVHTTPPRPSVPPTTGLVELVAAAAPPPPSTPHPVWGLGDRVDVLHEDGNWYAAVVTESSPELVKVQLTAVGVSVTVEDGEAGNLRPPFLPGAHVLVTPFDERDNFPSTVVASTPEGYLVETPGGGAHEDVPAGAVRTGMAATAATDAAPPAVTRLSGWSAAAQRGGTVATPRPLLPRAKPPPPPLGKPDAKGTAGGKAAVAPAVPTAAAASPPSPPPAAATPLASPPLYPDWYASLVDSHPEAGDWMEVPMPELLPTPDAEGRVKVDVPRVLLPGHRYQVRVCGVNAVGRGAWGPSDAGVEVACPPGPPEHPPVVTVVPHAAGSATSVSVLCTPPSPACDDHTPREWVVGVQSGEDGDVWSATSRVPPPHSPAADAFLFLLENQRPGTALRVRACFDNGHGRSPWSQPLVAFTRFPPPLAPRNLVCRLAASVRVPTGKMVPAGAHSALVAAAAGGYHSTGAVWPASRPLFFSCEWDAPSSGTAPVLGYEVVVSGDALQLDTAFAVRWGDGAPTLARADESGGGKGGVQFFVPGRSASVGGLRPDAAYMLRVRALNVSGAGPWSEEVRVVAPSDLPGAPPPPLPQAPAGSSFVRLAVTPPACGRDGVVSFVVQRVPMSSLSSSMDAASAAALESAAGLLLPTLDENGNADATDTASPQSLLPETVTRVLHTALVSPRLSKAVDRWAVDVGRDVGVETVTAKGGWKLTGLLPGTLYGVRLAGVNTVGTGPWSDWVFVATAPKERVPEKAVLTPPATPTPAVEPAPAAPAPASSTRKRAGGAVISSQVDEPEAATVKPPPPVLKKSKEELERARLEALRKPKPKSWYATHQPVILVVLAALVLLVGWLVWPRSAPPPPVKSEVVGKADLFSEEEHKPLQYKQRR